MTSEEIEIKKEILKRAYNFFFALFKDKAKSYEQKKYSDFKINPFTIQAAAQVFDNTVTPDTLSKAIVYPFTLGTSLSTSFGTKFQKFICTEINDNISGSTVAGMDIEYKDAIDGRKKYCQIKSGPTTINKDDIKTIEDSFKKLRNLARTNNIAIQTNDVVVAVLYGSYNDLSTMYKNIESDGYQVLVSDDFWYHLTGLKGLYHDLIIEAQKAAIESNMQKSVNVLLKNISKSIKSDTEFFDKN